MARYEARPPRGDKPLLVLGISDVIVLEAEPRVPATVHRVTAWGRWTREVVVPDAAPERIRSLSAHFEIVWASEWGHNAHTAFREALELPAEPWPFLPVQFDKRARIREYAGALPWAWVDGPVVDLHEELAGERPGTSTVCEADDGVIVRVDPHAGLAGVDIAGLIDAVEGIRRTRGAGREDTQA